MYYYLKKINILFGYQKVWTMHSHEQVTQMTKIVSRAKCSKSGEPFNRTPTKNAIKIYPLPVTIACHYYLLDIVFHKFCASF